MGSVGNKGFDVQKVRQAIPMVQKCAYLQTGSDGVMANPVSEKVQALHARWDTESWAGLHLLEPMREEVRKRIAQLIGANTDEVAFTDNATHGLNLVFAGLDWKSGDEILVSDEEYPALLYCCHSLVNRVGVKLCYFKADPDPNVVLDDLKQRTTPRTRLIAASEVSTYTGKRLPAREICRFASEKGIRTLVDGAQSLGVFPVDVKSMGCDFYAANGHKWLHGPKGTGVFYCKADRTEDLYPVYIGMGMAKYPMPDGKLVLETNYKRFEYGTRHLGAFIGLGPALDWLEGFGWQTLEQYMKELTDYTKQKILENPRLKLRTPMDWNQSSALISLSIEGVDGVDLREWLRWERNILTRRVFEIDGIRVSAAYFNTKEEIDSLFKAIPEYPKFPR